MGFELPNVFCWSKYGAEAGEDPNDIIERKDLERRMNGGVFLWGIGNSIRPSLVHLLELERAPMVLFTPMKARPKPRDSAPPRVVMWCGSTGLEGAPFELPEHSVITSRPSSSGRSHFALVCYQEAPIREAEYGLALDKTELRNLLSGTEVGASQVTAVVQRAATGAEALSPYWVRFQARLVPPYLVELSDPIELERGLRPDLAGPETQDGLLRELLDLRRRRRPRASSPALPGLA